MKGGVVLLRSIPPIAYSPRLQPGDRLYLVGPPPPVAYFPPFLNDRKALEKRRFS